MATKNPIATKFRWQQKFQWQQKVQWQQKLHLRFWLIYNMGLFLLENLILFCAGHKLIPEPFLSFLARHVGSALSGYWILPCQATLAIQPVEGTNERRRYSTWLSILNPGLLFISELLNQPFVGFLIFIVQNLGLQWLLL